MPTILSTGFLIGPNLDLKLPTPRRMTGSNPLRHPPGLREEISRGPKRSFGLGAEQKLFARLPVLQRDFNYRCPGILRLVAELTLDPLALVGVAE